MKAELKSLEINHKPFAKYIKVRGHYKWQTTLNDQACFIYWLNGENKLYTNNSEVVSGGKDALLLRCGSYIDEIFPGREEEVEAVIVHFYPDLLKKLFSSDIPEVLKNSKHSFKSSSFKVRLMYNELLEKYVESLLFYFKNPELADQDLLLLKLKELILLLSKTQQGRTLGQIFNYLFVPEELSFKEVIEAHLYSDLSLKELAYLTHRSLATFKRDFQKFYQDAPSHHIKTRKIEKAAQLLVSTNMRINNIFLECGFKNASHFTRLFTQKYKTSPSAFRLSYFAKSLS
jgi:AraC-like DNA-binding protein